jgi:hypothetical protein
MEKMAGESGLLKMSLPEISPEGVVIPHATKDMDPVEKQAATEKMRETLSLPPAPVTGIATTEERQSAEKLLATLSSRFLSGETIPENLCARVQQAAGDKIPFTDASVRKMILAIVQSPLYQVT